MELSVIIPIYFEQDNLRFLYERLDKSLEKFKGSREFIFINDGSTDNSLPLIIELSQKHPDVKYINLSRNFGHQIAATAGLNYCTGNKVVIIDADLQDPPELILQMHEKMEEGFDVVYAKRRKRKNESFFKKFTANLFYRLLQKITSIDIPLDTGDFRIMDKKIINVLRQMPEQHKFLRGQIAWVGFKQTFIEYDREERHAGETGYTLAKMFKFALDGITSFSSLPIKVASMAGFVVSGIAFILILYSLYSRLVLDNFQPGWASLMISFLFIGGIQLISIGIIGEYVERIATNVRNRPLYVIESTNIKNEPL